MAEGENMDASVDERGKAGTQAGALSDSRTGGRIRVGARPRKRRSLADLRRGEEGQSLVEFALVFTFVLMPLFFGFMAFAWYLLYYQAVTQAVGSAGQQLAVSRGNTADPCATALSAFEAASPLYINPAKASVQVLFEAKGASSYKSLGTNTCAASDLGTGGGGSVQVIATYTIPCVIKIQNFCTGITAGVSEYVY
jgi:hypothetical protein